MKAIKNIVAEIREELAGAEHYAKCAAELTDERKADAEEYKKMAEQELNHANILHGMAKRMISEHRSKSAPPPSAMLAVWDWEHQNMIEQTAKIKVLLNMVK